MSERLLPLPRIEPSPEPLSSDSAFVMQSARAEPRSSPCTPAWHRPWSRPRVCRPSAHRWHRARARESGKCRACVKLHGNGPSDRPMWPKPSAASLMLGAAPRCTALHSLVHALRALPWRASSREPRSPAPPRGDSECQFRIADWTAGINLGRSTTDLHVPFAAADRHGFTHPWPSALTGTAATPDAADFPGSNARLPLTGSRQTPGPLQASPR